LYTVSDEIEQLYAQLKPMGISPAELFNVDESRIKTLETIMLIKKPLIPCKINPLILQKKLSYENILKKTAQSSFRKNNNTKLKFDDTCKCCMSNKVILMGVDSKKIQQAKANLELINVYLTATSTNTKTLKHNKKVDRLQKELSQLQNLKIANANNKINCDLQKIISDKKKHREIFNSTFKNNSDQQKKITKIILEKKTLKLLLENNSINNFKNKIINQKIENLKKYFKTKQNINLYNLILKNSQHEIKYQKYILKKNKLEKIIHEYEFVKFSQTLTKAQTQKDELEITHNLYNKTTELSKLKTNRQLLQQNRKAADQINLAEQYQNELMETHNNLSNKTQQVEMSITKIKLWMLKIDKLKTKTTINTARQVFLELYKTCVDRKGIPQIILRDLCIILNRECNNILNEIADFELDIKYDTKGILRIYTSENGMRIPASMASGYQKFIMDMIMRIVLASCLSHSDGINNISNPNILIIDEGFGCLDKKNFIEVAKVMKKLKKNFICILVITHIEELKTYADKIININRVKQESKLEYMGSPPSVGAGTMLVEMRRIKLREAINEKTVKMQEMRAELNKGQIAKKEKLAVAKKAKDNMAKHAKKLKQDRKNTKDIEKNAKVAIKARLITIMTSEDIQISYLIEIIGGDKPTAFKCRCCNKEFSYSKKKIKGHVNGKTYKARHKKFIATIL
jgi:DNA repair exonuclease SbcCD ATPase subunit